MISTNTDKLIAASALNNTYPMCRCGGFLISTPDRPSGGTFASEHAA